MKRSTTLTAIALILSVSLVSVESYAFSFSLGKDKSKAQKEAPAVTSEVPSSVVPTEVPAVANMGVSQKENLPIKKEMDPIAKELQELQKKHYEEMQENEEAFNKQKAELLGKYRKKIMDENPEKLQQYLESCESQAVQRYMMEQNTAVDGNMMMPIAPSMPPQP